MGERAGIPSWICTITYTYGPYLGPRVTHNRFLLTLHTIAFCLLSAHTIDTHLNQEVLVVISVRQGLCLQRAPQPKHLALWSHEGGAR